MEKIEEKNDTIIETLTIDLIKSLPVRYEDKLKIIYIMSERLKTKQLQEDVGMEELEGMKGYIASTFVIEAAKELSRVFGMCGQILSVMVYSPAIDLMVEALLFTVKENRDAVATKIIEDLEKLKHEL